MPTAAKWYDETKTVVYHEMSGKLTIDDLYVLTNTHHTMLNSVDHYVHMMLDWRRCETIPTNIITHARNLLAQKTHPRTGITVLIGMRLELRIFWGAFERAIRLVIKTPKFLMADTPEQGYEMLMDEVMKERSR
jgi:hypothetical protein